MCYITKLLSFLRKIKMWQEEPLHEECEDAAKGPSTMLYAFLMLLGLEHSLISDRGPSLPSACGWSEEPQASLDTLLNHSSHSSKEVQFASIFMSRKRLQAQRKKEKKNPNYKFYLKWSRDITKSLRLSPCNKKHSILLDPGQMPQKALNGLHKYYISDLERSLQQGKGVLLDRPCLVHMLIPGPTEQCLIVWKVSCWKNKNKGQ